MADQVRVNLPDLAERYLAYSGQLREMAFADFFFCMIYSKKLETIQCVNLCIGGGHLDGELPN